ncbi:hypothetical protein P7H06_22360 [Paenibacillus larvae]|nr:hypothetical protein [Paenibacillus larvae]MDT2261692.1 hypothetical protein [Paenibacillus larvae]
MKLVDASFKNASSSSKNFGNAQNQLRLKAEHQFAWSTTKAKGFHVGAVLRKN